MNQELEKYIDLAVADGVVTEKEKNVLIRKAQELGVDQDELEMVLEAKLYQKIQEHEKKNDISSNKNLILCPNCGASINQSAIKCQYCGFEVEKIEVTGEKFIKDLQKKLNEADEASSARSGFEKFVDFADMSGINRKASIITTFNMPNDKNSMLEFFLFCDSNVETYSGFTLDGSTRYRNKILKKAWLGKAIFAFNKLELFADDDEHIEIIINKYKDRYSKYSKKKYK
ncbi:MAG: hypothetical protein H8D45_31835 [Bacteroidetes bacterium]|nr:hypothetical protein [Bacteroidota bacterium]